MFVRVMPSSLAMPAARGLWVSLAAEEPELSRSWSARDPVETSVTFVRSPQAAAAVLPGETSAAAEVRCASAEAVEAAAR